MKRTILLTIVSLHIYNCITTLPLWYAKRRWIVYTNFVSKLCNVQNEKVVSDSLVNTVVVNINGPKTLQYLRILDAHGYYHLFRTNEGITIPPEIQQ